MATKRFEDLEAKRAKEASDLLKYQNLRNPDFYAKTDPSQASLLSSYRAKKEDARTAQLASDLKRQQWYGDDEGSDTSSGKTYKQIIKQDPISKILSGLQAPVQGLAGGIGHVLGKGTGSSIGQSVMESVDRGEAFGGLLKRTGVNPSVSAPLGFALDVIADPFNWIGGGVAMGLSRTAPGKAVVGVSKAGTTGLRAALRSSGTKMAYKGVSLIPGLNMNKALKKPLEKLAAAGIKTSDPEFVRAITSAMAAGRPETRTGRLIARLRVGREALGIKASEAAKEFDEIIGTDIGKIINQRADRLSLTGKMWEAFKKLPGGEKIYKFFEYDNNKYFEYQRLMNAAKKQAAGVIESGFDDSVAVSKKIDEIMDIAENGSEYYNLLDVNPGVMTPAEQRKVARGILKEADEVAMTDMKYGIEDGGSLKTTNELETEFRKSAIWKEVNENISKSIKETESVNAARLIADSVTKKLGVDNPKVLDRIEKVIGGYEAYMGLFKTAKISSLSPTSMVNAILGNPTMSLLYGLNPFHADSMKRMKDAMSLVSRKMRRTKTGQNSAENILKIFRTDPVYAKFYDESRSAFNDTFGIRLEQLDLGEDALKEISRRENLYMKGIEESAVFNKMPLEEQKKLIKEMRLRFTETKEYKALIGDLKESQEAMVLSRRNEYISNEMKKINSKLEEYGQEIVAGTERYNNEVEMLGKQFDNLYGKSNMGDYVGTWDLSDLENLSPSAQGFMVQDQRNAKGYAKLTKWTKHQAEHGTGVKRAVGKMHQFALKRSGDFQKVDQIYKLKDFLRLTLDGVTEKELLRMTDNFLATNARIRTDDILESFYKGGDKYFRISPEKSMEIASDIYMNYAAMPYFIQLTRNMPIFGSPFYAFSFSMMQKAGKALLNNPAAFNKVSFFMDELGVDLDPIEREAMKSKYSSWLGEPGMMFIGDNIPFFKNYPLFLNLTSMIPYYSLDILNSSDREGAEKPRGKVISVIDKTPLFKDPVGQTLMDYVIAPLIMKEEVTNAFGGPLYEKEANGFRQTAYATRDLVDAMVPSSVAAGLGMISPEKTMDLLPYTGRKVGYAVRGKTPVGIDADESPASRGMRAWLGVFGINLYPLYTSQVISEIKSRTGD